MLYILKFAVVIQLLGALALSFAFVPSNLAGAKVSGLVFFMQYPVL